MQLLVPLHSCSLRCSHSLVFPGCLLKLKLTVSWPLCSLIFPPGVIISAHISLTTINYENSWWFKSAI